MRVCAQMAPTLGQETNILVSPQESHWVLQTILNVCLYLFIYLFIPSFTYASIDSVHGGCERSICQAKHPRWELPLEELWAVVAEFWMSLGPCSGIAFPCSQHTCGQRALQPKINFCSVLFLFFFWGALWGKYYSIKHMEHTNKIDGFYLNKTCL